MVFQRKKYDDSGMPQKVQLLRIHKKQNKMKKAGIITIVDYVNYGNRLQNYAAQHVLSSLGFDVVTISNTPKKRSAGKTQKLPIATRIKNALSLSPIKLWHKALVKIDESLHKKKYTRLKERKRETFMQFSNQHIKETDFVVHGDNPPKNLAEQFDFFSIGSDQIWNPDYRNESAFDFAAFAPIEKRIAWSPSFGVSVLPAEYHNNYRKWLNGIEHLSVREEAGARIIKELTGKDAEVLVDPTLMLTKDQWLAVSRKAGKKPAGKYLLTYFVGKGLQENLGWIKKTARRNNLQIVHIASTKDPERFDADPGEFIDYIKDAELFCTDSFHGIIFSIHMETPFVVFERTGRGLPMSSRTETLLGKFDLKHRVFSAIKNHHEKLFTTDFTYKESILQKEREKGLIFLKKATSQSTITTEKQAL